MTWWVPPLSARVLSRDRAARSHDRSRDCAARINCPPTPRLACVWGGVSMGPAICYGPGAISMKRRIGYKGPLPTHTRKLHTQVLGTIPGIGQGLPFTIVFLLGLSLLYAVVWAAKHPRGEKG